MAKTNPPKTLDPKTIAFFYKNGTCSWNPKKETQEQGRQRGARKLAYAEQYAKDHDWRFVWEEDPEEYQLGDAETTPPNEVLTCVLKDARNRSLTSLGGIGDPSRDYGRVVEAELASEALADVQKFEEHKRTLRDEVKYTRHSLTLPITIPAVRMHLVAAHVRACIKLDRATRR
jgi:hypothetical protein